MQVLKKIWLILGFLTISACDPYIFTRHDSIIVRGGVEQSYNQPQRDFSSKDSFKVAMLLPLTGKASSYGQGLKNAAMIALEDANNPRLVLQFYDTHSSESGAREAARQAASDDNVLILGPLMSEEVAAVTPISRKNDIPVISFSTSTNVLQEGVYTLGLLGDEQVERIISFAAQKKRQKVALLVPDSSSGINIAKAAIRAASKNGVSIVKIGFYPPETLDFSKIVKELTNYEERSIEINQKKQELTTLAKAGDRDAQKELNKLKTVYSTGAVDFDAVLIAESSNRLKAAASTLSYYDVSYPDVLFLGTSMWENSALFKETTLYHGVYPQLSRVHNDYFNKKYQSLFGQQPNMLYSFAYDGVALASALSYKNPKTLEQSLTDPDGFIGINGTFRILSNGKNQHSLDIVEITENGLKTLDQAPKKLPYLFESYSYQSYVDEYNRPQIFGKDPLTVYRYIYD